MRVFFVSSVLKFARGAFAEDEVRITRNQSRAGRAISPSDGDTSLRAGSMARDVSLKADSTKRGDIRAAVGSVARTSIIETGEDGKGRFGTVDTVAVVGDVNGGSFYDSNGGLRPSNTDANGVVHDGWAGIRQLTSDDGSGGGERHHNETQLSKIREANEQETLKEYIGMEDSKVGWDLRTEASTDPNTSTGGKARLRLVNGITLATDRDDGGLDDQGGRLNASNDEGNAKLLAAGIGSIGWSVDVAGASGGTPKDESPLKGREEDGRNAVGTLAEADDAEHGVLEPWGGGLETKLPTTITMVGGTASDLGVVPPLAPPTASLGEPLPRLLARQLIGSEWIWAGKVGPPQPLGFGWEGNLVVVRLDMDQVAVVFRSQARGGRGMAAVCQVSGGTLGCGEAALWSTAPIHHLPQSLAAGALWSTKLLLAWRQGSSPWIGHVHACMADATSCGTDVPVRAEWGAIAVVVISSFYAAFAFTDVQLGHRGSIVLCGVAGLDLDCGLPHVFEKEPTGALALAVRTDEEVGFGGEGSATRRELLIAYEAGSGHERSGRLQPCAMSEGTLACWVRSTVLFTSAPSSGVAILYLVSGLFAVGYADRLETCPPREPREGRRQALNVCTLEDGHPSVGRVALCRATFPDISLKRPILECGQSNVVDDGPGTGVPSLARADGKPSFFLAAYSCVGCTDQRQQALARWCAAEIQGAETAGMPLGSVICGESLLLNDATARWVGTAAVERGFVVGYDDYGSDAGRAMVRYVA